MEIVLMALVTVLGLILVELRPLSYLVNMNGLQKLPLLLLCFLIKSFVAVDCDATARSWLAF